MEMNYLETRYDSRASFYNKAVVLVEGDTQVLLSYNLKVCEIKNNQARLLNISCYSDSNLSFTTLRHIKEFLLQNNFKAINKKQIVRDYLKL